MTELWVDGLPMILRTPLPAEEVLGRIDAERAWIEIPQDETATRYVRARDVRMVTERAE